MKRKLFFILLLFLISSIYVFGENFPQKAKTVNDFIPKGWKEILTTNGDLNRDKLEDTVMVIEKEDKKNIKKNDGFGPEELNLNPRILLVLFKQKDGTYILASKNDKGFIKSEGNDDNPALMDTLDDIIIKNNVLKIVFNYFMSAGSWWTSTNVYIFRFQNNVLELIGYESNAYMRNTGEEEGTSINFSTNKAKITTGENNPKDEWRYLKFEKKYILDEMTESTLDEILDIVY